MEKELIEKIIETINKKLTEAMNSNQIGDLGDIGNLIGISVGSITCKDGKDLNILYFEKDDFESGFSHGYSLMDGTH